LADLGHNHLAKLAVSTVQTIMSRCEQERACRVKLVTRMICPHILWF